jgi:hypothetical protein
MMALLAETRSEILQNRNGFYNKSSCVDCTVYDNTTEVIKENCLLQTQ